MCLSNQHNKAKRKTPPGQGLAAGDASVSTGSSLDDVSFKPFPSHSRLELVFAPSNTHILQHSAQATTREYYSKPAGTSKALSPSQTSFTGHQPLSETPGSCSLPETKQQLSPESLLNISRGAGAAVRAKEGAASSKT